MKKIASIIFLLLAGCLYAQQVVLEGNNGATATVKNSGKVTFELGGNTTSVDFGNTRIFNFVFGATGTIKSKVTFYDVGYYDGAAYLYGKVASPMSSQIYRVAIRIEKLGTTTAFKMGVYMTTPKNANSEEPVKYNFVMSGSSAIVNIYTPGGTNNVGVTKLKSFVISLSGAGGSSRQITSGEDYPHPTRSELYPKLTVGFPTEQSGKEGGLSAATVDNLKLKVKATAVPLAITGTSNLPPLSVKFNVLSGGTMIDGATTTPSGDSEEVYYTTYGGSLLIPILNYQVGIEKDVEVTPFSVYGNTKVNQGRTLFFSIDNSNDDEVQGNIKYVTVDAQKSTGKYTATDDDRDLITLELKNGSGTFSQEGGATTTVTVKATPPAGSAIASGRSYSIPINFSGTASFSDYEITNISQSGNVVLNSANGYSVDLKITATPDTFIEKQETLNISLGAADTAPTGSVFSTTNNNVGIGIEDSSTDVTLSLSDNPSISEDATNHTVSISLTSSETNQTGSDIVMDITYPNPVGGSTKATLSDFDKIYRDGSQINPKAFPTSFVIHSGHKDGVVTFTAEDDAIFEGNEELPFSVASKTVLGRTLRGPTTTDLTIIDNDVPKATITLTPKSGTTNLESEAEATLKIALGKPNNTGHPIKVTVNISGTATLNNDYTLTGIPPTSPPTPNALEKIVEIPDGAISAEITIKAIDDGIFEDLEETATFEISGITDDVVVDGENTKHFTIKDNEKPVITVTKVADGEESDTGTKPVKFEVTSNIANNTTQPLSFNVAYSGTATEGEDFFGITTVTIESTEHTAAINLDVIDDNDLENLENVKITLAPVAPLIGRLATSSTLAPTANIKDNDSFGVTILPAKGKEGGDNVTYTLSIDKTNKTGSDITIPLSFSGTATQDDFTTIFPTSITIADGASVAPVISLAVKDDDIAEGLEKLKLEAVGTGVAVPFMKLENFSREAEVEDNDSFEIKMTKVSDGNEQGKEPVKFKIELFSKNNTTGLLSPQNNTTGSDIDILFLLNYNTASFSDFENLPTKATIEEGKNETILSLNVADDAELEREQEEVKIKIIGVSYPNVIYSSDELSGFIEDNDHAVLSVVSSSGDVTEGSGVDLTFKVTLDKTNGTGSPIVLQKSFINKTLSGWVNAADFSSSTELDDGTIEIANGHKDATISMAIKNDIILEAKERVGLKITIPTTGVSSRITGDAGTKIAAAEAAIIDDKKINLHITSPDLTVNEGASDVITFSIGALNKTGKNIVFKPSYSGLAKPEDFNTALPSEIVFPPNKKEVIYTLSPKLDGKLESDEGLEISFLKADNPIISGTTGISILIKDADSADIVIAATPGKEGGNKVVFKASLKDNEVNDTSADILLFFKLNTSGAASASSVDFKTIPSSIVIPKGGNSGTISLEGLDDNLLENTENVSITVNRTSNEKINQTIGSGGRSATTTLEENGSGSLDVEAKDLVFRGGTLVLKYVLPKNKINELGSPVVIKPKFSGTYKESDFITPFPQTVSIPVGASYAEVTLKLKLNESPRPKEILEAGIGEISVGGSAIVIKKGQTKSIAIEDDLGNRKEINVFIKKGTDGSETPNKSISFSINLEKDNSATVPIFIDLSYSGEATARDFVDELPSQVEIPVGKKSVTVTVKVKEDFIFEEDKESLIVKIESVKTTGFSFDFNRDRVTLFVKDSKRLRTFSVLNNGISPNGDGINDVFKIGNIKDMTDNQLFIVNREGITVYHQSNYNNTWGGVDFKGRKLPMGNYYYVFLYKIRYEIQGRIVYRDEKATGGLFVKY